MKIGRTNRTCIVVMPRYRILFFRVCGYGLSITDHRLNPPLFSERNGRRRPRPRHLGPWCFAPLARKQVGV